MNEDTRVVVCCYAGDQHQVIGSLGAYLHHQCPVTILSPEDSPAGIVYPGVDCKFAGRRAYIGQESLDRQLEHLKLMLTYPEKYFLVHDSDSFLLDPKIPAYLYAEPDVVWSNQVDDAIPEHQDTFPEGWPHVAFQPPYFLSRATIEKMVAVGDDERVKATHMMPFIDYYMMALTTVAGLPWKRFMDCVSCPIAIDVVAHPLEGQTQHEKEVYGNGYKIAMDAVLNRGAVIVHSIKDPLAVHAFLEARKRFLVGNPEPVPRASPPPIVGRGPRWNRHSGGGQKA